MKDTGRVLVGYALPVVGIILLLLLGLQGRLSAVERFLGATLGLLFAIKAGAWQLVRVRGGPFVLSPFQKLLYWSVWPDVRPDLLARSGSQDEPDGQTFVVGYLYMMGGIGLALAAVLAVPVLGVGPSTWLLLFAFLAFIHFGVGRVLPFCLRWLGHPVPPLFDSPLKSSGLGAFWGDRWNRPFIHMNRLFITRPLKSRLGAGGAALFAFFVSGILHELAISYSAGGGWGGPLLYFIIQAGLFFAERILFPTGRRAVLARRLWTYAAVFVPLPLLFHAPFRMTFLAPLVEGARSLLLAHPLLAYVGAGLWVGAAGHLLVLAASWQVPRELDWHTDLQRLRPLNRKLMWTYGGFIVMMILSFAALTVLFHGQFLAGQPVALGVCGVIAVFWTARILVDFFYFTHEDWPGGVKYIVGHTLLTSLFVLLVAIYGGTIAFHVL